MDFSVIVRVVVPYHRALGVRVARSLRLGFSSSLRGRGRAVEVALAATVVLGFWMLHRSDPALAAKIGSRERVIAVVRDPQMDVPPRQEVKRAIATIM